MSLVTSDRAYIVTCHNLEFYNLEFHKVRDLGDIVLTRASSEGMCCFYTRDRKIICANGHRTPIVAVSLEHGDDEHVVNIVPCRAVSNHDNYTVEVFVLMSNNTLHKLVITRTLEHKAVGVKVQQVSDQCVAVHCYEGIAMLVVTTGELMIYRHKALVPTVPTITGLGLTYLSMWCDKDSLAAWDTRRLFVQYRPAPTLPQTTCTIEVSCVAYAQVLERLIMIHTTYGSVTVRWINDDSHYRTYTGYKSVCPVCLDSRSILWLCCKHDGTLDLIGYDRRSDQGHVYSSSIDHEIANVVLTCTDSIMVSRMSRTKPAIEQL